MIAGVRTQAQLPHQQICPANELISNSLSAESESHL
jgi:hypothetical protein